VNISSLSFLVDKNISPCFCLFVYIFPCFYWLMNISHRVSLGYVIFIILSFLSFHEYTPSLLSCLRHYWSVNTSPPFSSSLCQAAFTERASDFLSFCYMKPTYGISGHLGTHGCCKFHFTNVRVFREEFPEICFCL
jgi:hypothetical protein